MAQNEPTRGVSSRGPAATLTSVPEIPDKLYFRIGDVARICDVPAYVLRFWETEFPHLKPNKGGTGQRLYRRRDVELALRIKRLLYDEGYTIPGARQLLKADAKQHTAPQLSLLAPEPPETQKLKGLRRELQAIAALLSRPPGAAPRSTRTQRRASSLQPSSPQAASASAHEVLFDLPGLLE
jgi:DNA-binding transcriptional MerR regulator